MLRCHLVLFPLFWYFVKVGENIEHRRRNNCWNWKNWKIKNFHFTRYPSGSNEVVVTSAIVVCLFALDENIQPDKSRKGEGEEREYTQTRRNTEQEDNTKETKEIYSKKKAKKMLFHNSSPHHEKIQTIYVREKAARSTHTPTLVCVSRIFRRRAKISKI